MPFIRKNHHLILIIIALIDSNLLDSTDIVDMFSDNLSESSNNNGDLSINLSLMI